MSHLPLSLEFRIAELDFRTPLISTETLAIFQDAFDKRSRERKKKSRNEKRLLRKLNAEEMKKQGKCKFLIQETKIRERNILYIAAHSAHLEEM